VLVVYVKLVEELVEDKLRAVVPRGSIILEKLSVPAVQFSVVRLPLLSVQVNGPVFVTCQPVIFWVTRGAFITSPFARVIVADGALVADILIPEPSREVPLLAGVAVQVPSVTAWSFTLTPNG